MAKNNNIIWVLVAIAALIIFLNVQLEPEQVTLNPRYYKEGVEIFPQTAFPQQRGLFSIVTPPGGSYDQISFDIYGSNTGNVDINNMQVDASPLSFDEALGSTSQTLTKGQSNKLLWSSSLMNTSQFESTLPTNFSITISGESSAGEFQAGASILILIEEELDGILYEYFNGGGARRKVYSSYLVAQTFTIGSTGPNENFEVNFIKLMLSKMGNPGIVDISIKRVDVNGFPTGNDLSIGTIDSSKIITSEVSHGQYSIKLSPYVLQSSTMYAVVIKSQGDYWNALNVDSSSSGTYSGGEVLVSQDNGVSWRNVRYLGNEDLNFEIYGKW